jgi:hypothetical protein
VFSFALDGVISPPRILRPVDYETIAHQPFAQSTSPMEQVATVRPYWSSEMGMQFNDRLAIKASRSFAALAPHRYWRLSLIDEQKARLRTPALARQMPATELQILHL